LDTKAYIESGILESYALGLCNEAESEDVQRLCKTYPELQTELEQIRSALYGYAQRHAQDPPAFVKKNIFDTIDHLEKTAVRILDETEMVEAKVIPISKNYRFAIAASIALFVLSSVANIILYQKWRLADEQVLTLNAEKSLLSENDKTNHVKLDLMQKDMDVMGSPEVQKVMMKGVAKSPESMAMVFWNKATREVFLQVKNLPQPATGKQYQLWAIVDGKPVDAGMLPINNSGDSSLMRMKDFGSAQAFAITLENEGGSPVPTMTEMYVMGAI